MVFTRSFFSTLSSFSLGGICLNEGSAITINTANAIIRFMRPYVSIFEKLQLTFIASAVSVKIRKVRIIASGGTTLSFYGGGEQHSDVGCPDLLFLPGKGLNWDLGTRD